MNFANKFIAAAMTFITSISAAVPTFAAQKNFSSTIMHRLEVNSFDSGGTSA